MRAGNGKNKKITIIMVILAIVLGASLCLEKEHERATNQRTMVEENNIKYYFRGDSGDYSFDGARKVLNETPVEGAIKETVNYEDRLSVWREEGDIWKVTIEENIGETPQNTWHTKYRFRSGSDFSEETLVEERDFHSNYKRSFYIITENYATPEDLRQIIENGENICAGLNAGNVAYSEKACIVTE